MNKAVEHSVSKAVDSIQARLTSYACDLDYQSIPPEVIHAAKARVIDTLGALIMAFFSEPCRISRDLAVQMPDPNGATIIGTRRKTTLDMAAFVNGTTAAYPAMTDSYHQPGGNEGHASETVMPLLGVGEHAQVNGREFLTSIVLGYEVFLRMSDIFNNDGFDQTNFGCIANATAAGKLLKLSSEQLAHAISMAVVSNNILRQVKRDRQSMFKPVAAGQAARGGVFAAMLARAGMEGPHLPFEGKAGWCDHVARNRFSLESLGGNGTRFKILDTLLKTRASEGKSIAPILAAEKLAPFRNIKDVKHIVVETHKKARDALGVGEHRWSPATRQDADHSIPYVVAATLMDGTVTLRTFDDAHLKNPDLHALIQKIEIVENAEFNAAYQQKPQQHRARVTISMNNGEQLVGESGGDKDNRADQIWAKTDEQIVEKFRKLTEDVLGAKRVNSILERLWHIEDTKNIADIPPELVFV